MPVIAKAVLFAYFLILEPRVEALTLISTTSFGIPGTDIVAYSLVVDSAGKIFVGGVKTPASLPTPRNWTIIKYNASLTQLTASTEFIATAEAMIVDGSGNLVVAGPQSGPSNFNWGVYIYSPDLSMGLLHKLWVD